MIRFFQCLRGTKKLGGLIMCYYNIYDNIIYMFVVVGVNSHIDILYINTILGQIVQLYKQAQ